MDYRLRHTAVLLSQVSLCVLAYAQSKGGSATLPHVEHHKDALGSYAIVSTTNYLHSPLLEALLAVNQEYGWAVSFEDVPTVNPSEIVDSEPELHRKHPELTGTNVANDAPYSSKFPEIAPQQANIAAVLQQIVADYNATNNHGKFKVVRSIKGNFAIVGYEYHDTSGKQTLFVSPLECLITVEIRPANIFDAMRAVVDSVNTTCGGAGVYKIDARENVPDPSFGPMEQVSGSYVAVSARNIMMDLLSQLHEKAYYSIFFGPVDNYFGLNTWGATRNFVDRSGKVIPKPVPNPGIGMEESEQP
jgi:hypothetical protein